MRFKDDPWPLTEKVLSSEDFNKNINFYNHSKTSGPGGDLGFNIFVANPSETTVLYIALPWLCIGYGNYWRDNPIISHTKRKILSEFRLFDELKRCVESVEYYHPNLHR
ncbi:hypothetical protein [Piscirickettsia salmonis]|uniref:hypothetical protein n=1 Tax=Piscirickettsia salmonis TaxID=1238 RepID=UPI00143CF5BA|nr:hypothetical protein [Piscirickettsia salmonis]QIX57600.1 hypothetical protein GW536_19820 [Piscirickettsia salmonis]